MIRNPLSKRNHSPIIAQSTSEQTELPQQSNWLSWLWNALVRNSLDLCEPNVAQKRDRFGQSYDIYDPRTGRSAHSLTENEARIWLEQLHH